MLLSAHIHHEPSIRAAALKALVQLKEAAPQLSYRHPLVKQEILNAAHHYYEMSAALVPFAGYADKRRSAAGLLARTLQERLRQSIQRLFRLLGLRYPSQEMHWAYLAFTHGDKEKRMAAVEFLDNILDQDLKRVLLPLLESERVAEAGRSLFRVEAQTAEATASGLLESDDRWLVACAIAAAAELGFAK